MDRNGPFPARGIATGRRYHTETDALRFPGGGDPHRDRPTRFGFDGCRHFATRHGCAITVVNQESLSPQEEMVADWMAVVPAFSCRLYGLRSYRKQIRDVAHHG